MNSSTEIKINVFHHRHNHSYNISSLQASPYTMARRVGLYAIICEYFEVYISKCLVKKSMIWSHIPLPLGIGRAIMGMIFWVWMTLLWVGVGKTQRSGEDDSHSVVCRTCNSLVFVAIVYGHDVHSSLDVYYRLTTSNIPLFLSCAFVGKMQIQKCCTYQLVGLAWDLDPRWACLHSHWWEEIFFSIFFS